MMMAAAAVIAAGPAAHLTPTLSGLLAPVVVSLHLDTSLVDVLTLGHRRLLANVIPDAHKVGVGNVTGVLLDSHDTHWCTIVCRTWGILAPNAMLATQVLQNTRRPCMEPMNNTTQQRDGAVQAAAYGDRLDTLQVALHDAVRALSHATALTATGSTVTRAHHHVLDVLGSFVAAWEALVALQEKLEEVGCCMLCICYILFCYTCVSLNVLTNDVNSLQEEQQLFKSKTTEILTEDQEDEQAFQQAFPDTSAAFADLATLHEDLDGSRDGNAQPPAVTPGQGSSTAARSLLQGPLLLDIVNTYGQTFSTWALPCTKAAPPDGPAWEDAALKDFDRRYALGQRALAALDYVADGEVDRAAMDGHLLHCSRTAAVVGAPLPPRALDAHGMAMLCHVMMSSSL